jgi:predicted TIM-barrel fold metal-dependent hydrolase
VRLRDEIGIGTLMWGSDYPHTESTFPRSREILASILRGATPSDVVRVVASNAAELYGFDVPEKQ